MSVLVSDSNASQKNAAEIFADVLAIHRRMALFL
jgi:hypothetical protein